MKKRPQSRGIVILLAVCLLCAFCGLTVFADTKEVHDGDLIVTDAGIVTVDQTVEGDLLGVASEMRVTGTVKGSIRVAAGSLTLSGRVERNVTVAATELKTAESLQAEDVVILGVLAEVKGNFESLTIYGTRVVFGGHVEGELICEADQVIILEGATFGSAKIVSQNDVIVASDASAKSWKTLENSSYAQKVEFTRALSDLTVALVSLLYTLPAALLLAWAAVWFMKRVGEDTAHTLRARPVRFLLCGLLTFLGLVFGSVFLIANPLTMSLGFILLLLLIAVSIAGNAVTAVVLGRVLFRKKSPYTGAALITVILSLVSVLPWASLVLFIPTAAISFGTLYHVFSRRTSRRNGYASDEPDFRL